MIFTHQVKNQVNQLRRQKIEIWNRFNVIE